MAQMPSVSGAFKEISILPPSFDLVKAMEAVEDMKALERVIDEGSRSLRSWRMDTQAKLKRAMDIVDAAVAQSGMPKQTMGQMLKPNLDAIWEPLEGLLATYALPMAEMPDLPDLSKITGPTGRFLRRQSQRLEDLRVEQYNAIVDWKYGLLAFASEYEPEHERTASFSDGASLEDYLRKRLA